MKHFGFMIVQDYATGDDTLIYREKFHIPLVTKNTILMVKTIPWGLNDDELQALEERIENRQERNLDEFCMLRADCRINRENCDELMDEGNKPVFIINEATLP